ncbi:hypothetical protein ONZ43_g7673 [Nemania bipapillata]|uniref:Uncharacterized protein n=1 Tax=Nemania bipapillata TaxID=110536 RepID=A0ACC2HP39_9PEZI|nr:hypothetical protein ONZ43_g7673 [Nemania bipapillata]
MTTTSTSDSTAQSNHRNSSSAGISAGAIAGIAIGVILGVIVVLAIAFYIFRTRRKQRQQLAVASPDIKPPEIKPLTPMDGVPAGPPTELLATSRWPSNGGIIEVNPTHPVELPDLSQPPELGSLSYERKK